METNYYHVTDPLENFDLKVVVRESSRAITGDDLLQNAEVYYEEFNISWQEKLYGPSDIVKSLAKNGPASESQVCDMIRGSLILLRPFILLCSLNRQLTCIILGIQFCSICRTL